MEPTEDSDSSEDLSPSRYHERPIQGRKMQSRWRFMLKNMSVPLRLPWRKRRVTGLSYVAKRDWKIRRQIFRKQWLDIRTKYTEKGDSVVWEGPLWDQAERLSSLDQQRRSTYLVQATREKTNWAINRETYSLNWNMTCQLKLQERMSLLEGTEQRRSTKTPRVLHPLCNLCLTYRTVL